jgi:hypothetical protein
MADQKLIVVLGATGNQGSSVVNTFLKDAAWRVRGLTRNPSSAKAKALSARGVEVVQADMDDISSLSAAFRDANAIFVVSDFWGIYGALAQQNENTSEKPLNLLAGETELQQLKNAIDAASRVPELERFILSTLSNVTKWSGEKYTHVYHFDLKARASAYVEEMHPELWAKTSLFQAGLFLNTYVESPNFIPQKASQSRQQRCSKSRGNVLTLLRTRMESPNSLPRWPPTSSCRGSPQKKTPGHSSKLWSKKMQAKISLLTESGRLFEKWCKLSKTPRGPSPKWWWCLVTSQMSSCRPI